MPRFWFLNLVSHWKEPGLLGDMTDCKSGAWREQLSPSSCCTREQGSEGVLEGHGGQLAGVPLAKCRPIGTSERVVMVMDYRTLRFKKRSMGPQWFSNKVGEGDDGKTVVYRKRQLVGVRRMLGLEHYCFPITIAIIDGSKGSPLTLKPRVDTAAEQGICALMKHPHRLTVISIMMEGSGGAI